MTAIVGDSGAGKSTISKLVMRMYDPQRGCVRIDGHDLRSLNLRDVHQKIGIVSQSPDLFDVSLEENIAYGSVSADWTRADVEQAAKIANCNFIGYTLFFIEESKIENSAAHIAKKIEA